MPRKLGITVNNIPLTDEEAKLISLYIIGLNNKKAGSVVLLSARYLRNIAWRLYGLLDTQACAHGLAGKAREFGFDSKGNFKDIDLFSKDERERLYQVAPELLL